MSRLIQFVLFPGFQVLDVTGPLAAFEIAARYAPDAYTMKLTASEPGRTMASCAVALETAPLGRLARVDTLIIAGGDGVREARRDRRLLAFAGRAAGRVRRLASVCSGAMVLAEAGLLDGRRATTHWSRAQQVQKLYPRVRWSPDRIWVKDGAVWTSAGITAGIDLALAMIGEDLGPDIAHETARQLVVYVQRPGGQTQHSRLLDLGPADGRFAALNTWMRERIDQNLDVETLAAKACMSSRTFARAYTAETGVTPAKAVERMRVEAARALIDSGSAPLDVIARRAGFGDAERMRRAFVRLFGAPPSSLRRARAA